MTAYQGIIIFEASVPFFEPIKATNEQVNCILNTKRGTISFVANINDFHFERALMKEHFNENYMESKKYPKATFKGLIEKFDLKNITPVAKEYYIKGKMSIHGKSKNISVPAKIKKVANGIQLISNFTLKPDEYNIAIPYIVRSKIATNVKVTVKVVL
jgi:polyisoprenoid-binding protein YceI